MSADKSRPFLLLAVFLGISLTIKYTSVFFIFSTVLAVIIFKDKLEIGFKKLFLLAGVILLLFLPWGLKDIFYYGNPVYPIFAGNDFCQKELGIQCHANLIENSNEDVLLMNGNHWMKADNQIFSNIKLLGATLAGNGFSINSFGPWILIFLPLLPLFYFRIKSDFVRAVYLMSAIYSILWLIFMSGQAWYLLPAIVGYLIILGYIFEKHFDLVRFKQMKSLIAIWGFLVMFIIFSPGILNERMLYAKGEISIEQAWSGIADKTKNNPGNYNPTDSLKMNYFINQNIIGKGSGKLIYSFIDPQGYFIKDSYKNFIPDFFGYLFGCIYQNGDAYGKLKKLGVGYVLADASYFGECNFENKDEFKTCVAQQHFADFVRENNLSIVHREGGIILYELK